jgi:tRNA threonylcarbamoyladenosine biosynthesis protein TsaB
MLTLAFDTSSRTASVAILNGRILVYEAVMNTGANHSEVLLSAIDEACRKSRCSINEMDFLCCTTGPGSFTGLRIGISTLKGFILATGKPAVGVSSLMALAMNVDDTRGIICPVMDAGRGQVYTASFLYDKDGVLNQVEPEKAVNPDNIGQQPRNTVFVGDGAVQHAESITQHQEGAMIRSRSHQMIRGFNVGILGQEKYRRLDDPQASAFSPLYLRCADAVAAKSIFS